MATPPECVRVCVCAFLPGRCYSYASWAAVRAKTNYLPKRAAGKVKVAQG